MDYKVLLPVTNNPELVQDKLKEIDLSKLILINNFDNKEVELLCQQAEVRGAEVLRYPRNLGLAASWNVGLRKMKEQDKDFVIILSVSAVLEKPVSYFAEQIIKYEETQSMQSRYLASGLATLHCFAHTSRGVDIGGYFDENFYPIYYEDMDFSRRSQLNGLEQEVKNLNLEDFAKSRAYSIAMKDPRLFKLFQLSTNRMVDYYNRKWGGYQLQETFSYPFNNSAIGVNEWTVDPSVTIWPEGVYEGNFQ